MIPCQWGTVGTCPKEAVALVGELVDEDPLPRRHRLLCEDHIGRLVVTLPEGWAVKAEPRPQALEAATRNLAVRW